MSRGKRSGDRAGREQKGDEPERFSDLVDTDTIPLADRKRQRAPTSPPPTPSRVQNSQPASPRFEMESEGYGARAAGLSRNDFAKLRRGEIDVEREVDLHGLNSQEAKAYLEASLENAVRAGERCVMAIHGQGRHSTGAPVLRTALPAGSWAAASRRRCWASRPHRTNSAAPGPPSCGCGASASDTVS